MIYNRDSPPNLKMDLVLQCVVNLPAGEFLNYSDIAHEIDADGFVKEVGEILLKLYKDGYVSTDDKMGRGYFVSNFDGRLFIYSGGYTFKALRDAEAAEQSRIDAARLIDLESQNLLHSGRLNTLTHRLVIATWFAFVSAVFLLLWNVWIWFYPLHKDYPYWFWQKVPAQTHVKPK